MDPVIFYINGAYRTWRQTKHGMLLRLATRREINRANRLGQVTCGHECLPPGCGHCTDFTLVEDLSILRQLLENNPGLDTLFYIHRKAKRINDHLCAKSPEWNQMSDRDRPMFEKKEELMGLWASKLLLKFYPDDIRSIELATKTTVEELTKRIKELDAQIVW
jgi:hypothetical protein